MPARSPASPDFQALILCGPGLSFNTFTSTPEDFPKALVPIANRPMIWYPLDWCQRMSITRITLITPQSSRKVIEDALSRNPHLTSLPHPRADLISPEGLSQNTGTAEILRFPEVQAVINGHFMVLPCDLISELAGITLLETWMVQAAGTIGSPTLPGALGVWFPTKGEHAVKGEETNFVITAQLPPSTVFPHADSLRPNLSKLVYATTTDTLNDITEDKKCLPIRHGLLRKHGRIRTLTTTRDAHIYLFPYWTLDFINQNPTFDSIGEDIVGWWAKASWQDGLVPKLGLDKILSHPPTTSNTSSKDAENTSQTYTTIEDEIDLLSMSSTHISNLLTLPSTPPTSPNKQKPPGPTVPPFLAYIHPSPTPLIRRIDTPALLLHTSLHLASLPPSTPPTPTPTPTPSPHAHPLKYHPTASIAPRTTISADTLIAANTTIAQHSNIKNCVIGAGCTIGAGARLTRCVVMDEVEVGEKVVMTGAVVGSRARVGKGCVLLEGTEVQPGFCVEEGTEGGKGEKFMGFEGLEDDVKAIGGEEEEDMGGEGIEMDVDEGENGREHMM